MGLKIDNPLYIFIGYKCSISNLADKHIKLIQSYEEEKGKIIFRLNGEGLR